MERAVICDIEYKWTDTNAFSWTLHDIATYLKKYIKFLMLLVKSNTLWGKIKYTKHARNKSLSK
jgi:hypothetical protein